MTAISDLVLRLESAHGPDRLLDLAISVAVNFKDVFAYPDYEWKWGAGGDEIEGHCGGRRRACLDPVQFVPRWTGDAAAALSLLPWTEHPGATFTLKLIQGGVKQFYCRAEFTWPSTEIQDRARTPELVVCLVALRAIERTLEDLAPYQRSKRSDRP